MSMTPFQLEGLRRLGYTTRESEFLFLVATHSGYFTTRQFRNFAHTDSGSVSHAFVQRLLAQHHATYHSYRSGGRVYHLFARKVYQAIERENLRTRKKHELEYVKTRLVTLDFVLAHLSYQYLETEQDKREYFVTRRKVGREMLPVKQYRARQSADVTLRYFVDRFPMFLGADASEERLTFTFVDAEAVTLNAFETHLRAYLPLFRALSGFEFVYAAPTSRLFASAETLFWERVGRSTSVEEPMPVMDYFRLRKAWDAKERVASLDVVALKKAETYYAASAIDSLYEKWRTGNLSCEEIQITMDNKKRVGCTHFRTQMSGSSLCVFNGGTRAESENRLDAAHPVCEGQVSGGLSVGESL